MTGAELFDLLATHVGEPYVLGAIAPKDNADYHGPWDCAELTTHGVYQATRVLFGCTNPHLGPARANAYTGAWGSDAMRLGCLVSVEMALGTPGAFLLRLPAPEGGGGHVACSDGNGGTVEAHSTNRGVITTSAQERRWSRGVVPPGITYAFRAIPYLRTKTVVLRLARPRMTGPSVVELQEALGITADGIFGVQTHAAVLAFQKAHGLVVDGEVGAATWAALRA